jgi:hypothetical protein
MSHPLKVTELFTVSLRSIAKLLLYIGYHIDGLSHQGKGKFTLRRKGFVQYDVALFREVLSAKNDSREAGLSAPVSLCIVTY